MTVLGNVAYPLKNRKVRGAELKTKVGEILDAVGIGELAQQYPGQLSGGQQQRVALARAIVAGDDVILFDEPLSNVDAKVRDRLRIELLQMQHQLGFTAIYVTHDQEEAMTLGTRIAVLQSGEVAQLGTPREIYKSPSSHYVANFIGAANEIPGDILRNTGNNVTVQTVLGDLHGVAPEPISSAGARVLVRPEDLRISDPTDGGAGNRIAGVVTESVFRGGGRLEYLVEARSVYLRVWVQDGGPLLAPGTGVTLRFDASNTMVFGAAR